MNREEFIVSAAIVLFLTFLLGWLSRWLIQRLNMVSEKDLKDLNKISTALLEAEQDNEKLNFLTRDWVKEIISQVADKDSPFLDSKEVSSIYETTQNNLKDTTFEYLKEEQARKDYGEGVGDYLRSQGLPCVKLKGASDKKYLNL